jgi:putative membrane protein (TIGR04086 family)
VKENIIDSLKGGLRSPWIAGQLYIWTMILMGSFIIALFMRYTSMTTNQLPMLIYTLNALSLLTGGFVAGKRAGTKGWAVGGIQGIIYVLLLMLICFLSFDASMAIHPGLFMICAFGLSSIGGIFGVNTSSSRRYDF